ncbi:sulfatase-like hydrolase/transferase [Cyclobacterium jeungdonense]|uniref:alpha-L-rhamnosidase n=1 Tax=Cyclobacterium jeungdonense TaxID=708087 RepID=A0ABT8C9V1_9BACT|nr:sulfatase-like hydrolase/transferase [Cyclobacterium jeungdonense]MDN3689117.1 family 78 glycoside hydrolase catalytic domain [Cyclobacterium jeungdonense]
MLKSISTILVWMAFTPLICQAQSTNQSNQKPNIIFILTDDQRWDALGHAGNDLIHTPEMDRLAEEGAYFKNALVTTPICAASRATIFTGLYERTHAYTFQTGPIREEYMETAYPKLLKEAGYRVGFFGKYGVNHKDLAGQFDEYESYDRNGQFRDRRGYFYKTIGSDTVHLTRYTGQQALDFIDQANPNEPFCLSLSFSAPHAHDPAEDQYFWQQEVDPLLQGVTIPDADLSEDRYFEAQPEIVKSGFNRLRWTWRYDTPEKYQHSVKGYYRMISGIDREIAKIRKQLRDKGLDQNTVIILMGDNGYFLGERQLAGKWLMYDNSIRVPLIVHDPRVAKPMESEALAANVDVPATILDLAGLPIPAAYQGKSLVPVIQGREELGRDTVLIEHLWDFENIPPSEGLRTADWKYFRYINDKSIEELYYLAEDSREINNLASDPAHAATLQAFRKKMDSMGEAFSDESTAAPKNLHVEMLRKPAGLVLRDLTPEFGWQVPEGMAFQTAYQVLVSSSPEKSYQNIGDIWNSGKIQGKESFNIAYKGPALQENKTYYWKVRIWDGDNRTGRYSPAQPFQVTSSEGYITTANRFMQEDILPQTLKKVSPDTWLADFGKAAFASLTFSYQAAQEETLTLRLGEQLQDGRIHTEPQGHIRFQEVNVSVSPGQEQYAVQLPPDERNTGPAAVALPDSFPVLLPFRYAEITATKQPESLTQKAYFGYFEEDQSSFSSSDTILNQVWDLCKYTMKATSFAGIYVDGDRERIPYEADAYINQLSHYAVDWEYPIARRSIEYFMENPTWPTEWQLHVALMFYEDYLYTGNTELIEKYYEELKHKTLMELAREDGLISSSRATPEFMKKLGFKDPDVKMRDIVDWPPAQKDTGWELATEEGERDGFVFTPINTVINALYFRNLEIMGEFARIMGKTREAMEYDLMAAKVKKAVTEKLMDPEKGIYLDGEGAGHSSLHANMMPLAFNMVPKENIQEVVEFIKSRGMACSVYGSQYLMDGLYNAGAADYALDLMTATHDRSWWNMIAIGSTMTLEAWDMKYKPNADWNHAWGAVPGNIVARKMWGIVPKTPGGGLLEIRPQLSRLTETDIIVPFLTGKVKASYKRVNNRLQRYAFDLPANVSADLFLEFGPNDAVSLNGEKVNTQFGSIRLSPGRNEIELQVNSF